MQNHYHLLDSNYLLHRYLQSVSVLLFVLSNRLFRHWIAHLRIDRCETLLKSLLISLDFVVVCPILVSVCLDWQQIPEKEWCFESKKNGIDLSRNKNPLRDTYLEHVEGFKLNITWFFFQHIHHKLQIIWIRYVFSHYLNRNMKNNKTLYRKSFIDFFFNENALKKLTVKLCLSNNNSPNNFKLCLRVT